MRLRLWGLKDGPAALGQPQTNRVKWNNPKRSQAQPQTTEPSTPHLLLNPIIYKTPLPGKGCIHACTVSLPPLHGNTLVHVFLLSLNLREASTRTAWLQMSPKTILASSSLSSTEKAFAITKCDLKKNII